MADAPVARGGKSINSIDDDGADGEIFFGGRHGDD